MRQISVGFLLGGILSGVIAQILNARLDWAMLAALTGIGFAILSKKDK